MLALFVLLGLGLAAGAAMRSGSSSSSLFITPDERAELERARAAQLAGTPEQRAAPDIRRSWTQIATDLTAGRGNVQAVEALATTLERQGFHALASGLRVRMRAANAPPTLPPLHPGTSQAERRELEAWARLGDGRDYAIESWNTLLRLLEQPTLTEEQRAQIIEQGNEMTRLGLSESAAGIRRRLAQHDRRRAPQRGGASSAAAPCVARWSAQDRASGRRRDLGCFATLAEAQRSSPDVLVAFERAAPRHPSGREWCEVLSSDLTLEDLRDRQGLARWAACPTRDESEIATMTARLDRAFQDAPTDQDAMLYAQIRDGMRRAYESRA